VKKLMLAVVMLAMVLAGAVPALAQLAEEPRAPCETGPFSLIPGEFVVYYYSEEEMWAAPQENVIDTSVYEPTPTYFYYMQTLYFEDIASIQDPCERFAAQEAKLQEILAWPGVKIAGNGIFTGNIPVPAAA
jgi:hypothetical protein